MPSELWMRSSTPFWPGLLPHYEIMLTQAQLMNLMMNYCILFYKCSRKRKQWSMPGVCVCVFFLVILATDTDMALSTCCIIYIMPGKQMCSWQPWLAHPSDSDFSKLGMLPRDILLKPKLAEIHNLERTVGLWRWMWDGHGLVLLIIISYEL